MPANVILLAEIQRMAPYAIFLPVPSKHYLKASRELKGFKRW